MHIQRSRRVRMLTTTAAAAAVMAALAPWSIPLTPVPITLCTLMIYMMGYILGWKRALAAVGIYVVLGAAGLPVFSGFGGGLGVAAGPTGGFILGYLPMAALCAAGISKRGGRTACLGWMVLSTLLLYAVGTVWYCLQTGVGLLAGLAVCAVPCIPGDAVKMLAASALGPALADRMCRAGLLE